MNFPGLPYTPAKYEKNLPYGCEAIVKRKCRASGSSGVASPIYKQASPVGRFNILSNFGMIVWIIGGGGGGGHSCRVVTVALLHVFKDMRFGHYHLLVTTFVKHIYKQ